MQGAQMGIKAVGSIRQQGHGWGLWGRIRRVFLPLMCVWASLLVVSPLACAADAVAGQDQAWLSRLKVFYFQDRPIDETSQLIQLTAPDRAEDGALVPITVAASIPQTDERYIKTLHLIIDNNPNPLAGKFTLTPLLGKADLALLIRVDAYSPVRVVAETNDGKLHMSSKFVKASGGCSAPARDTDMSKRLGDMRFSAISPENMSPANPVQTRLSIQHPNVSGLQKDQVTTLFIPPRYVKSVEVRLNDEVVFSAETDISISENPNFQFYLAPDKSGILTAVVTDTDGQVFTHRQVVGQAGATLPQPTN